MPSRASQGIYATSSADYPQSLWKTPLKRLAWKKIEEIEEFVTGPEICKILQTWARNVDLFNWRPSSNDFMKAMEGRIRTATSQGTDPFARGAWAAQRISTQLADKNRLLGFPYQNPDFDKIAALFVKTIMFDIQANKKKSWCKQNIIETNGNVLEPKPKNASSASQAKNPKLLKSMSGAGGLQGTVPVPLFTDSETNSEGAAAQHKRSSKSQKTPKHTKRARRESPNAEDGDACSSDDDSDSSSSDSEPNKKGRGNKMMRPLPGKRPTFGRETTKKVFESSLGKDLKIEYNVPRHRIEAYRPLLSKAIEIARLEEESTQGYLAQIEGHKRTNECQKKEIEALTKSKEELEAEKVKLQIEMNSLQISLNAAKNDIQKMHDLYGKDSSPLKAEEMDVENPSGIPNDAGAIAIDSAAHDFATTDTTGHGSVEMDISGHVTLPINSDGHDPAGNHSTAIEDAPIEPVAEDSSDKLFVSPHGPFGSSTTGHNQLDEPQQDVEQKLEVENCEQTKTSVPPTTLSGFGSSLLGAKKSADVGMTDSDMPDVDMKHPEVHITAPSAIPPPEDDHVENCGPFKSIFGDGGIPFLPFQCTSMSAISGGPYFAIVGQTT